MWKITEAEKYVFIQETYLEDIDGLNFLVERTHDISADIVNGRFHATPKINGKEIPFEIPDEQYNEVLEILRKQCKKHFGFAPQYEWGENNFEKIKNFVRFPLAPQIVVLEKSIYSVTPDFRNKMLLMRDENGAFEMAMKYFGIVPTKTLRKTFFENPYSLLAFILIKELGFNDLNVINDIISDPKNYYPSLWGYNFKDERVIGYDSDKIKVLRGGYAAWFCEFYLPIMNERKVVRFLNSAFLDTETYDAFQYFMGLGDDLELEQKEKILDEGFTEYNQRLLRRLYNEYQAKFGYNEEYKNVEFDYSLEEKSLEKTIGGYDFRLAKDSDQLLAISGEMQNCVGHLYQDAAKKHESIIMYAATDEKYKVCIELIPLDNNQFRLKQCLGKENRILDGELLDVCKEWISQCNAGTRKIVEYETCLCG